MEKQILRGVYPERSRRAQDDKSPEHPSSLTPEQFRRMLSETLAADPNLARRLLWPLSGTVFAIQGGNPATVGRIAKIVNVGPPPVVDDSVMFELSGNIGLGTIDPLAKLHVVGDLGVTAGGKILTNLQYGGNNYLDSPASSSAPMRFFTGAAERMRIDYNGKVYVSGNPNVADFIAQFAITNLISPYGLRIDAPAGAAAGYPLLQLVVGANENFRVDSGAYTGIRLISSGNVGIGKPDPSEKLDVAGNILSQGLNKIVFLKPGDNIQTAINNLPSNGGIIYLTPGTYNISSTITISKNGVKLRGYGGIFEDFPTLASGTGSITNGFATVTGTSTHFTTQMTVGDQIVLINSSGVRRTKTIVSIASDSSLTVDSNFTVTESGDTIYTIEPEVPPVTKLLWTGSSGASQIVISLAPSRYDTALQDVEISGLLVDGGLNPNEGTAGSTGAGIGLQLSGVSTSVFRDFHVRHMKRRAANGSGPSIGINLTTQGPHNTDWNLFENCTVIEASQCVVLNGAEPTVGANSTHNTFTSLTLRSDGINSGDAGIFLVDCDNNAFYRTWIQLDGILGTPGGYGVVINNPVYARANYFYHLESGRGLRINNANLPFSVSKNLIFGYDQENAQPDPSTDTGNPAAAFLFWTNSRGSTSGIQDLLVNGNGNFAGLQISGAAPSGQYLRGNGAAFVASPIQAADVPGLDASKITSGQLADARMPTDVVKSQDGAAHKIAAGSVLVSAGGSATVSTGLSAITGFGVEHLWTNVKFVQHAATVSGGSITIYNDGVNEEYFTWIALGS